MGNADGTIKITRGDYDRLVAYHAELVKERNKLQRSVSYHREMLRITARLLLDAVDTFDDYSGDSEIVYESNGIRRRVRNIIVCTRMPLRGDAAKLIERCEPRATEDGLDG